VSEKINFWFGKQTEVSKIVAFSKRQHCPNGLKMKYQGKPCFTMETTSKMSWFEWRAESPERGLWRPDTTVDLH
jgi:hypothetical protein